MTLAGLTRVSGRFVTDVDAEAAAGNRSMKELRVKANSVFTVAGTLSVRPPAPATQAHPPPTLHLLDDGEARPTTTIPPAPQPEPPPPLPPPAHTVAPGEHFWAVAEQVMTTTLGRAPTDGETASYWLGLIEANRHILADPDNPDLVFPGQVLTLPEPTSGPEGQP
jgi:nucleoid-associated protein YgaU